MNNIDQKLEYPETKPEKKLSVVKVILCAIVCFALLAAVILSNVQQLQLTSEITAKQKLYTDMQSENVRMQTELAGKTSNKNVQEYAENVLGMHVLNPSQVEYIQIQTDDVVEIPEEEQNLFVRIKSAFDSFTAYMRG
ncbi:MAG: cell division protein FtsL [Oscillospiraceae bacterium]|nr:cell division protein FtsL [Oscillospiraceae bacterium]